MMARATSPTAMRRSVLAAALATAALLSHVQACTTTIAGRRATSDGSVYTTSTSDCLDCDFRLAKVPARKHSPSEKRPVYSYKSNYPHVVSTNRAPTWHPDNLEGTPEQLHEWRKGTPEIGHVPEQRYTYSLLETGSGYGLINEKGVAMGESTCIAIFAAKPVSHGGHALLDIAELSKIALERTSSAREAIQLMGDMAVKHGYYGAEWDLDTRYDEAGENLMVGDPNEAWVFHILPDDTGRSAIWAAQRVPEDHITVVANQFIIRNIDPEDKQNFMFSDNMYDIAIKHKFHVPERDGPHLDFTRCFMMLRPHSSYSTHRVWRVFTLANPDLVDSLDPFPSSLMDGYPFSVKPKKPLSAHDMIRIQRDHYEGSIFDMTKTDAAEPYGDPSRHDSGPAGNMTVHEIAAKGEFGRAISIGRTSYAYVARSTNQLPELVSPMLYYCQQQPDSSVFMPVYVAAETLPRSLTSGNLFTFNYRSMFWMVTAVSNWVHKYYNVAIGDLRPVQKAFEDQYVYPESDAKAAHLVKSGAVDEAKKFLTESTESAARQALKAYYRLFPQLIARFHDGFRMEDATATSVTMTSFFYSYEWLKTVGFFGGRETGGGDSATPPVGYVRAKPGAVPTRVYNYDPPAETIQLMEGPPKAEVERRSVFAEAAALAPLDAGSNEGRFVFTAGVFAVGVFVGVIGGALAITAAQVAVKTSRRRDYVTIA